MLPQMILAASLGLDPASIRLIVEDVGGAFGAKALTTPEEVVVAWVARHLGRPVRWAETRSENLLGVPHGRGQQAEVSLGLLSDCTFTGLSIELVQDAGAYPDGAMMIPNYMRDGRRAYALPRIDWSSKVVATNATPISAFAGPDDRRPRSSSSASSTPQPTSSASIREKLEEEESFSVGGVPAHHGHGNDLRLGKLHRCLGSAPCHSRVITTSAKEQAKRRQAGDRRCLGLGLAIYVELANPGGSSDATELALGADGRFVLTSPATPYGQGLETTFAQIAASRLGVPIDHVTVRHGDTAFVMSPGTGGSKSTQTWGVLADRSAVALIEAARDVAASLLEASTDDVVFDEARGSYHVVGTPARALGWIDLARGQDVPLCRERDRRVHAHVSLRCSLVRRRGRHRNRTGGSQGGLRRRRLRASGQSDARRGPDPRGLRPGRGVRSHGARRLRQRRQPADREPCRLRLPVGRRVAVLPTRLDRDTGSRQRSG